MIPPQGTDKLAGLNSVALIFAGVALYIAAINNVPVTVTSGKRTREQQQALYEAAQRGESKYPAARPGHSAHEVGLAWDSTTDDAHLAEWVSIRRLVGWHVPDDDLIHAEVPNWEDWVGTS